MNEEIIKKQIGELLLSIGEGKFSEKAREILKYQFNAGYKYKENKIETLSLVAKDDKLLKIKNLLDEKSDFFDNEVISELLKEIYWKIENEILGEQNRPNSKKN